MSHSWHHKMVSLTIRLEKTPMLSPVAASAAIGKHVKAIIPSHAHGESPDIVKHYRRYTRGSGPKFCIEICHQAIKSALAAGFEVVIFICVCAIIIILPGNNDPLSAGNSPGTLDVHRPLPHQVRGVVTSRFSKLAKLEAQHIQRPADRTKRKANQRRKRELNRGSDHVHEAPNVQPHWHRASDDRNVHRVRPRRPLQAYG